MRHPALATLVCLGLASPVAADELPPIDSTGKGDWNPTCRAVTKRKPGPRNVGFRLKCNFSINSIGIRTSRPLSQVRRRPAIDSRRERDRLVCRKRRPHRARCHGDLSSRARVLGAFTVPGNPCRGLVTTFDIFGGACPNDPGLYCIAIGYSARLRVEQPRGC